MSGIVERSAGDLRGQIASIEAQYPDIATFAETGCTCCDHARFAEAHGWQNVGAYNDWSAAHWLLGDDE
jgi:hypothetical protein